MRWANNKIGFDDRVVMVAGILILSFFIPIIFFGFRLNRAPYFTWNVYWPTLVITTTTWLGCRMILIWARKRYPHFPDVKKRLWVQVSCILLYTLIINNLLHFGLPFLCYALLEGNRHLSQGDLAINANAAAILCTMLMIAIYESVYFINELRKSIEEKETLKRESLQAQLNALRIQVNPHFLFNNLNTLSAVIPDNPDQAVDFVEQLAKVYRHILEVRDEQSILLKEEMDVLEAYAFLLKTRFGENLDISIRVADEKLKHRIVPLALQILMENAIKHNVVSAAKPLRITIRVEDDRLIVWNNLQRKQQVVESMGIGLDNIRDRYLLLGNRRVEVLEEPSCFTVSIPLIKN